ncbi:MAG: hypothetical protein H0U60_18545 [Blastocatellia bacterium]|nr:hypothetical protein [Blastocatellia bacterium]
MTDIMERRVEYNAEETDAYEDWIYESEIWGRCFCGTRLSYQDGDFCPDCGAPIDDDDAVGDEQA